MSDPFSSSPLFARASRELRQAARESFAKTTLGQLLGTIRKTPSGGGEKLTSLLQRYARQPRRVLQELWGTDFGQMAKEIQRYARRSSGGPQRNLIESWLRSLGPAGEAIRALAFGAESTRDLTAAINLVRSAGFEVLPPKWARTETNIKRPALAAIKFLEDLGVHLEIPEGTQFQLEPPERVKPQAPKPVRGGKVEVPMEVSGFRKFPPNHPIVTGDMVPTPNSSNVHSVGYDADAGYLYVRFLAYSSDKDAGRRPGSLYRYSYVTPEEFLSCLRKIPNPSGANVGTWVWDHLRIRGTFSGHQKDYAIVGITNDYVPRKATMFPQGEAFIERKIKTTGGQWMRSNLPEAWVGGAKLGPRGPGHPLGPRKL